MTAIAATISTHRNSAGSCCARRPGLRGFSHCVSTCMAMAPPFERVNDSQQNKRNDQEHYGDRRGLRIFSFIQLLDDEQGSNLGLEGLVTGDEDDGSVFPNAACHGESESRQ